MIPFYLMFYLHSPKAGLQSIKSTIVDAATKDVAIEALKLSYVGSGLECRVMSCWPATEQQILNRNKFRKA